MDGSTTGVAALAEPGEAAADTARQRPQGLALAALVAAVSVAAAILQLRGPPNGDVAWLMVVGERMLDGQRLYADINELNPPMCALLYLPWVWLGRLLGVPAEPLVIAATIGLAGAALGLAWRIARVAGFRLERASFWFIGALVLMVMPGSSFAEREHFALIGTLPMLAASAVRAVRGNGGKPGRWEAIAAGMGGGLAMAIKPHFALALLLPALGVAWRRRSVAPLLSTENFVAGGIVAGFWSLSAWLFPAFFTTMLPLAELVYAGDRLGWLLLVFGRPTWPFWGVLAVTLILYRRQLDDPWFATLLLGALGFFLAYLAQGKGFTYQLLPAEAVATLALLLAFATGNAASGWRGAIPGLVAVLVVALPVLAGAAPPQQREDLAALLRPYGQGLRLLNLTPELETASPLERMIGARLVSSGPFPWMALGAIRLERADPPPDRLPALRAIEQRERELLLADLVRGAPDIILTGGDGFDWLGWAKADPAIAAQLAGYDVLGVVGTGSEAVTVLRRSGLQPAVQPG